MSLNWICGSSSGHNQVSKYHVLWVFNIRHNVDYYCTTPSEHLYDQSHQNIVINYQSVLQELFWWLWIRKYLLRYFFLFPLKISEIFSENFKTKCKQVCCSFNCFLKISSWVNPKAFSISWNMSLFRSLEIWWRIRIPSHLSFENFV